MEKRKVTDTSYFQLEEIADGVYAAIVKEAQGAWGNAGIVDLGDATLIFDTFSTPEAALELRRVAEERIQNPIRYVVNSHWHFDHVNGNQVFADATILSTAKTRDLMQTYLQITNLAQESKEWEEHLTDLHEEANRQADPRLKRALQIEREEKQQILRVLPELRLTLPQVTFQQGVHIQGSKRSVEVLSYGGGHSESDAMLLLPEEKILFSGDLVFVETHPSIHAQPVMEWVNILQQLQELDFEAVVPGHGSIGSKADVEKTMQYLSNVREEVARAILEDRPLEELICSKIPSAYENWAFPHVYAWNLRNLYSLERK